MTFLFGLKRNQRRKVFVTTLFLIASIFLKARAEDKEAREVVWTESVNSKDGSYAVSVSIENKIVVLLRSDDRELGSIKIRVRIIRDGSSAIELNLRQIETVTSPFKYSAVSKEINESVVGFELHISRDGHSWKDLGRFMRPGKR